MIKVIDYNLGQNETDLYILFFVNYLYYVQVMINRHADLPEIIEYYKYEKNIEKYLSIKNNTT